MKIKCNGCLLTMCDILLFSNISINRCTDKYSSRAVNRSVSPLNESYCYRYINSRVITEHSAKYSVTTTCYSSD